MSHSANSEVCSRKKNNHRKIEFRKWCLHLKTEWKSHQNQTKLFAKTWIFRQILIEFMTVYSQQQSKKMGTGLENVFQSASNQKRKKSWTKILFTQPCFPAVMNKQTLKSGFIEISLLHSQHYLSVENMCRKKKLNTVATEASSCFLLINGLFDETQMHGTNNVHLFWVNTRKNAVWFFKDLPTLFQVSHESNQIFNLIKGSTKVSWKLELMMCWNKLLKMLSQSNRQQFNFQISMCFSACVWIHIYYSKSKLIKLYSRPEVFGAE